MNRCVSVMCVVLWAGSASAASTISVPGDAATIAAAVGMASSGDTIKLGPGPFFENVNVNTIKGATPFALNFVGSKTIWDGNISGADGIQLVMTGDNVTIQGINFRHGVPLILTGDNVTVTACQFTEAGSAGAIIAGDSGAVEKCRFEDCSTCNVFSNGAIGPSLVSNAFENCATVSVGLSGVSPVCVGNTFQQVMNLNMTFAGDKATFQSNRFDPIDSATVSISSTNGPVFVAGNVVSAINSLT